MEFAAVTMVLGFPSLHNKNSRASHSQTTKDKVNPVSWISGFILYKHQV